MSDYGSYRVHPVADLFPLIEGAEFDSLVASIRTEGQHVPILLDSMGEVLVDGRNRYRACIAAGVTPRVERLTPRPDWKIGEMILSLNLERRHLTTGQRALLATEPVVLGVAQSRAEANAAAGRVRGGLVRQGVEDSFPQNSGESSHAGESDTLAGAVVGVSRDSVARTRKIRDAAESGDKSAVKAIEAIQAGTSINKAFTEFEAERRVAVLSTLSDEERARRAEMALIDAADDRAATMLEAIEEFVQELPTSFEYHNIKDVRAQMMAYVRQARELLGEAQSHFDNTPAQEAN